MSKSRRINKSRKMRSKRSTSKRRMSKRRMSKRSRSVKRGGLTCYNEQGWADRKGLYYSNGRRNEDCPIPDTDDYSGNTSDYDYNKRRGY